MGSSYFKITGHSGTEFKHRKAFDKIKAYQKQESKTAASDKTANISKKHKERFQQDIEDRFKYSHLSQRLKIILSLPILLSFALLVGFLAIKFSTHQFTEAPLRSHHAKNRIEKEKSEKRNAYMLFIRTGDISLRSNNFKTATAEFTSALKINPTGIEANIGMTKALSQQCFSEGEGCQEAKAYLAYVKSRGINNNEEIKAIEKMLAIYDP